MIFAHFSQKWESWHFEKFEAAEVGGGFGVGGLEDADDGAEPLAENGGATHAVGGEGFGCLEIVVVIVSFRQSDHGASDDFAAIENGDFIVFSDIGIR